MQHLNGYADRIYNICPSKKLSLADKGKIVVGMTPGAARQDLFQEVKDMIIIALDNGHHVRLMGHSYGGYFVSKLMSVLAKEQPDKLDRIRAVTMGTVRMHKYNPAIKITHYIFAKDPYGRLNWFIKKRPDVVKIRSNDTMHNLYTWHDAYNQTFTYNMVSPFEEIRGSLQMALPPFMIADRISGTTKKAGLTERGLFAALTRRDKTKVTIAKIK